MRTSQVANRREASGRSAELKIGVTAWDSFDEPASGCTPRIWWQEHRWARWNLVDVVPVLLVTGPIGVGKTAVLREADAMLIEADSRHATVELEEIVRCWTTATEGSRTAFAYENLASLWPNFVAVGAVRLLVSTLLEQRSDLRLLSEAIPDAAITVIRLHAPLSVLEQRIRLREPFAPDDDLEGARWWTQHFNDVQVDDHLVETENQPAREKAREVLRLVNWLP